MGPIFKKVHPIKVVARIIEPFMGRITGTPEGKTNPTKPPLKQPPAIRVCL